MSNIVKCCPIHGSLTIEETYVRNYKGKSNYYYCKKCTLSNNIKRKYEGMESIEDYDRMLLKQGERCALCNGKNNTTRNGKIKRFNIDHCHKTGKVRKLLCSFCNSMIGYARDNPLVLTNAIIYLTRENKDLLDQSHKILNERQKQLRYIQKRLSLKKIKAHK